MPNSVWYIGLAVLSIVSLTVFWWRTRHPRMFILFFMMVGTGFLIEFVIYVLLQSYVYHPQILDNPFDTHIGAIASNAFSLPTAATGIALFGLGAGWIWLIALFFTGIELGFTGIGIYEHHWWKYGYTFVCLPFYFWFAKWLWIRLVTRMSPWFRALSVFLIVLAVRSSLGFIRYAVLEFRFFHAGWFADPYRDSTAFATVYDYAISAVLTGTVMTGRLWLGFVALVSLSVIDMFMQGYGFIQVFSAWEPLLFMLCNAAAAGAGLWVKRSLDGRERLPGQN